MFHDRSVNRFFDFFMDEHEKAGRNSVLINYNDHAPNGYKDHRRIPFEPLLDLAKFMHKIQRVFKRRSFIYQLQEYNEFYKNELLILEIAHGIRFNLSPADLKGWFELIHIEKMLDNFILKRLKPTYLFSLCYYSLPVMVFNHSAAKMGIPTIELQHGSQTGHHAAYIRWQKILKAGFGTLPKYFWCWGEDSVKIINEWARNTNYHRAFNGGNPWIEYFKAKPYQLKPSGKPRILVTMQPTADILPRFLLDAIKTSIEKYEWWLRLHPRQSGHVKEIKNTLKTQGVLNLVNVNDATQQPLPIVLRGSLLHITQYSGTTIEAALLGIKTILIDKLGISMFAKQIEEGQAVVFLENNAKDLLGLIAKEKPEIFVMDYPENHFSNYCKNIIAQVDDLEMQISYA